MARRFTTNDVLTLATGSAPTAMAGTWLVVFRPYDSQFDILATNTDIVSTLNSAAVRQSLFLDSGLIFANNDFGAGGTGPTDKNGWYVCGFSKVTGTNNYRYHLGLVGGSFTHSASGSSADGTAGITSIIFGKGPIKGGGKFDIAAAVMFSTGLSDGAIDALGTSSMDTWLAGSPVAAWQFNQASTGTSVTDLVGSANQTALTGTSVVADPGGWSYHASTTPFTKDVVERYRVLNTITKDVVERYRVTNAFSKDVVDTYRVLNTLTKDVIERYRVTNSLVKDVVETYRVLGSLSKDVVERYRVTNGLTKDVVETYRVFDSLTKDVVEQYRVLGVWSKDVVERYTILSGTAWTKDLVERYRIFGLLVKDLVERYNVGDQQARVADVICFLGPATTTVVITRYVVQVDLSPYTVVAYLD